MNGITVNVNDWTCSYMAAWWSQAIIFDRCRLLFASGGEFVILATCVSFYTIWSPCRCCSMYIWGTANPKGEGGDYNGLYLTTSDIDTVIKDKSLEGLPVKIEHKGVSVGKVVVAWDNGGKLDMLVDVDQRILEGEVVSQFVRNNICQDFSLGYTVGLQFSETRQTYTPSKKTFNEVSIVRTGARQECHIHGYSVCEDGPVSKKRKVQPPSFKNVNK
jgi:hypothetical protein